jgi:hypothetical protein
MAIVDGYRIEKCISSGRRTQVYAAVRERDGLRVALKVYTGSSAEQSAEREAQILRSVAGPGVPAVLALMRQDTNPVLVRELVDGAPILHFVASRSPQLDAVLRMGVDLAQCMARMHAARIIHRDVQPENILVDPVTRRASLIGFGRASMLGTAGETIREVDFEQTGLLYVSPEGTGRMDRGVDARSDCYSLGATLYHVLTGRPPFDVRDPLELVHAHMALVPSPPISLRPELPATLSRIVMKLLQKEPEERYQSASALSADLRTCIEQLERHGAVADDFPLGTSDTPQRPLFPKRLHGREPELAALGDAFARAAQAKPELWLLRGPPGAGKSALAIELVRRIHGSGAFLANGKFDLYRREVPYSGFVSAFDALLQQRLAASSAQLERFRRDVRAGLGNLADALVELVPDLHLLLGEVSATGFLEPEQVRARLALAVKRFVHTCATREHPLVLCLDDLQWADGGSLSLIEELCVASEPAALLILGTYRDGEVGGGHPLRALLDRLAERGAVVHILDVGPLDESACTQLLAMALQRSAEDVLPLAREVAQKTANVPLLVEQFIGHAHEIGLLSYVAGQGWTWDQAGVAAAETPDDVIGLLAAKIERLESRARRVLEVASCVADRFDAGLLAQLGGGDPGELRAGLYLLCDQGLIAPCPDGFRFVHDRIREAAQARLSDVQRARWHHRAAHLLQESMSPTARDERVLELADHFNRALSEITDEERIHVVGVNVAAAERALAAGAPTSADEYLQRARALFHDADWSAHADLGRRLWLRSAACSFQIGRLEICLSLVDALEPHVASRVEKAGVIAHRIAVHAVRDDIETATELGIRGMRELGVHWPLHPSALRVRLAELALALELDLRGGALRPARSFSDDTLATLLVLAAMGGPASRVDVQLVALAATWAVRLMLRKGYYRGPHLALAALASNLCSRATRVGRARRYASMAADLAERIPDPVYTYRTRCVLHGTVYPWLMKRIEAVEPLYRIHVEALEMGDREYASYARAQRTYVRALSGIPLDVADQDYMEFLSIFPDGRHARSLHLLHPLRFPEAEVEHAARAGAHQPQDPRLEGIHKCVAAMLTFCVLGMHREAFEQSELLRDVATVETLRADLCFMRGLSAAGLARHAAGAGSRLRKALTSSIRQLSRWARSGPDFLHMAELLRAERAALSGRSLLARARYEACARRAQQQGYLHHAAMAYERQAVLLASMRRETDSMHAFERARALYERWQAHAKVLRMQREQESGGEGRLVK